MKNDRIQKKHATLIAIISILCVPVLVVSVYCALCREDTLIAAGMTPPVTQTESIPATTEATEIHAEPEISDTQKIPRLDLDGNISEMYDKSDERILPFRYQDGSMDVEGFAVLKIQGNSSLRYEKKNYTIKLYEDQTCNEKMEINVGWGEESKYCLKANWVDKTHARNIVTARLAAQIQSKYSVLPDTPNHAAIDGFPIEIYNNGEFLGLYTFNIPKDEWMLNMDGDNLDHMAVCGEDWSDAAMFRGDPNFTSWEVEVGEESDENLSKLQELYEFVFYSTDEEFKENFHKHLNLDATLNYYLIADFAYLMDNYGKNMLLITYDSQQWYPCLYDMDTSWGTTWDGLSLYPYDQLDVPLFLNVLFRRLEDCFGVELTERYAELRQDLFTKEHILSLFTSFRDSIPDGTFEKEIVRWGTEIPGADLDQIEDLLTVRIPILDNKYSDWDAWTSQRCQRFIDYCHATGIDFTQNENPTEFALPDFLDTLGISWTEFIEVAEENGIDVSALQAES